MTGTRSVAFCLSACVVIAGSFVSSRQQHPELSGIHGMPVEGHNIVAGIEIVGTRQLDLSRSGWQKLNERLRANGAHLGLGRPLESQTLCRFKEVLRDLMSEKGFLDVEISYDERPTQGNRRHRTLKSTVVEGKQSRRNAPGCATAISSGTLHEVKLAQAPRGTRPRHRDGARA